MWNKEIEVGKYTKKAGFLLHICCVYEYSEWGIRTPEPAKDCLSFNQVQSTTLPILYSH